MKKIFITVMLVVALIACLGAVSCGTNEEKPSVVTIYFETNGGNEIDPISAESGTAVNKPSDPQRIGYNFAGWWLDEDFSGTQYVFSKMPQESIRLYAKWEAKTFSIEYILDNGINPEGNPSQFTYGLGAQLKSPVLDGKNGNWLDAEGNIVTVIEPTVLENVRLKADFKGVQFDILYENMDGAINASENLAYYVAGSGMTLKDASKPDATFLGWFTQESGGEKIESISESAVGNITLYARFAESYKINYVLEGGTHSGNPDRYLAGEGVETLNKPEKSGYTGKWVDAEGQEVTSISKDSVGEITLTAQYTAIEYNITYALGGAQQNVNNPLTYTVETPLTILYPVVKDDFMFDKYTLNGQEITQIGGGQTGDIEIVAEFMEMSEGIDFTLSSDESGYIVGKGSFNASRLIIPDMHEGLPVLKIADHSFSSSASLTELFIGRGSKLISIGDAAFGWCGSLGTQIWLPESLKYVGLSAFVNTGVQIKFVGKNNLEFIGAEAFLNVGSIQQYLVKENGYVYFGKVLYAYEGDNSTIDEIRQDTVGIAGKAFSGKSSVRQIILPNSIVAIGEMAFENCTAITELVIPSSVKIVGYDVFKGFTAAQTVDVPDGMVADTWTDVYPQVWNVNWQGGGCQAIIK